MIVISLADKRTKDNPKALIIDTTMFRSSPSFIVGSVIIIGILAALIHSVLVKRVLIEIFQNGFKKVFLSAKNQFYECCRFFQRRDQSITKY
jgi:hypothetical protein